MNDTLHKEISQQNKHISVITLMAFLLAFFLHVQHIDQPQKNQNAVGDYQDCHLCQQNLDSSTKVLNLTTVVSESFVLILFTVNGK